jgi:hypothetical protein
MSSLSAPATPVRPVAVTVAVVLSVLLIIGNLASPAFPAGSGDESIPQAAIIIGVLLGVVGIPAVIGLWLLRRWGMVATIVVAALNLLFSLPGIAGAPTTWLQVLSGVGVLVSLAVLVLVLLPDARRAYQ